MKNSVLSGLAAPLLLFLTISVVFCAIPTSAVAAENAANGNRDAAGTPIRLAGSPHISVEGFTNAANFLAGPVAPGEIVSIFGSDLGPTTGAGARLTAEGRLDTSVGGTQVLFDGVPAPLFYVRNDQVNVQVPYSVTGNQSTRVQVSSDGTLSNAVEVPVATSAPGIFAYEGGKDQAVVFNEDSTLNSSDKPAKPGTIVVFYATGEGQTIPAGVDGKLAEAPYPVPMQPVTVTIGGVAVTDLPYAGAAPGFAGLLQVNARLPQNVKPGKSIPVVLSIGGHDSRSGLTMAVASSFEISNLRASGTNSSQGATLTIIVDFVDPSGSATRGDIIANFDINNGGIAGYGEFNREGVSPGQTSGTMTLSFLFFGSAFRAATDVPIVVSLVNEAGVESNQAVGKFSVQ